MYISTKQTCVDYRNEIFEELEHLMKCYAPSSQPEPSYHDFASVGFNSSEYWLGPFNSKEQPQLDASFRQTTPQQPLEVAHEIDSQSNVDIARSGISHSKKKNPIERIEKDYGITRQIVEQHFGMTLKQAAKALNVSRSTLKRIRKEYGISRWPHHKSRKVYHHVSQGIGLPGVADHLGLNRKDMITRSTLVDCRLLDNNDQVPTAPPRATGPVASLLNDLHIAREQNDALRTEIETLCTNLAESQGEVARLKDQLLQQQ
ncbi:hypothetical protein KY290_008249 [Solanum tuberosum]|uniref:RWP-RK domain-containing protein n=1 Tax=Solanum tuberosum TaxID=4113 RepID=A0ABQ7W7X8_SOLTU|nr:hypothetical protein KY285_008195 [Solanum tuberosum]KAH0776838.1 hypothetical protein KY290_008249 [Solanum tuberosum]